MQAAMFIDEEKREWSLRLDYSLVRSIRKRLGIDLADLKGQGEALAKMADNIELLVNTIYLIVEPQCQAKGITDEDFGRGLAGDAFERARLALLEAIINFTPPQDRGAALMIQAILTTARKQATENAIEGETQRIKELREQVLERISEKAAAEVAMESSQTSGA